MESALTPDAIDPHTYRHPKEKLYLTITIFITSLYYLFIIFFLIGGGLDVLDTPFFILGFTVFLFFMHLVGMASIRINSVKIGPNQFPILWNSMVEFSNKMGIDKPPDMYIINAAGELNAFAARLVSRKLLVLYSDLVDALLEGNDRKQLEAVVCHELAHHALNHTHFYNWFLLPADYIPFLGSALSRYREYSSDRVMKALIKDQSICERSLVKLVSGKNIGNKVNLDEYKNQVTVERGFFIWLSEMLSSHPHLPKRMLAIRNI